MAKTLEYEIIWKIRRLFRALATEADEVLKPMGLTAADRAVLEFLYPDNSLTVPQIARRFQVSRQHIQVTVNRLLELGLVYQKDNPDHARSPLLSLTDTGVLRFQAIRDAEQGLIEDLFAGIPAGEKVLTDRVLEQLLQKAKNDSEG